MHAGGELASFTSLPFEEERPGIKASGESDTETLDSQATPFSLIGRGREKRDWWLWATACVNQECY